MLNFNLMAQRTILIIDDHNEIRENTAEILSLGGYKTFTAENGTKGIPLIFLTAKAERSDLRKGMEMGADDYVTKPFEELELMNAIESRLHKYDILHKKYSATGKGLSELANDLRATGMLPINLD